VIVERRGIRLGLVSYTFGLNAQRPPADRPRIVNRMNLNGPPETLEVEPLASQLARCRGADVDFVVAHLHWGMEHELYPTPAQVAVAHHLAELGIDAIVGHHPHVVQPVECYRTRRDPLRVVPVFYSLGSLVNPFSAPFLCRSRVARLELAKGTWTDGSTRTYVRSAVATDVDQVAHVAERRLSLRAA
jgi:poly-gamma-glutamate synthesis protein (capsule biosynthesis protein)